MFDYSNVDSIHIVPTLNSRNETTDVTVVREGFEKDVAKVLDAIWATQTGRAVLQLFNSLPGDIFIIPNPGNPDSGTVNAEARPGSLSSRIPFEPAAFPNDPKTLNPGEVLFHELVHSVRELSGKLDQSPIHDAYEDIEEYFAIVVSNVYRSELNRIGLRGGHHSESLPPKQRDDAGVFLNAGENRKRLERLRSESPDLFNAVASVGSARWNPIRLMTRAAAKH
jgi:hypothetical protein